MSEALGKIRAIISEDVGGRGLAKDPASNLLTATVDDFRLACENLAGANHPKVAIITGFYIPHGQPPTGETDGPLGALFLAQALVPLGFHVVLVSDAFCISALEVGLAVTGLRKQVPLVRLPSPGEFDNMSVSDYWQAFLERTGPLTHLIALERVGPSHTLESLQAQADNVDEAALLRRDEEPSKGERSKAASSTLGETYLEFLEQVPPDHQDRCHTMRGLDITGSMSPAHWLFEMAKKQQPPLATLGIGDGGNEIGMGKISWDIIQRNIPRGGLVACRVPTDYLIVAGISNWGAYGLAAGVRILRGKTDPDLFDLERERNLLQMMVQRGPLVDGVSGLQTPTVDGLEFDRYAEVLRKLARTA